MALAGCYETAGPVIGRGVGAPIAPGSYRCNNDRGSDEGSVVISAPARLSADDTVYLVVVDKHRYAVRAAAITGDLFLIEVRGGDVRDAAHVFVRRSGPDGFELMATRAQPRERFTALAQTHGVALTFAAFGTPSVQGPPDRLRAYFLAHTLADLERTSTCRQRG
ncbi:MAG TPA: hypothetical protein VJ890_29205 [Vineibacter sp.]|nr:hypothetical protein [Vineibacter sp.]